MKMMKSDTQLNEKDAILDMLESEKQLMSFYTTALFEGSSKNIRSNFRSNLQTVAENQYSLFSQMSTRGYYTTTPAQKQQIDATCDTFKKQKKQLAE